MGLNRAHFSWSVWIRLRRFEKSNKLFLGIRRAESCHLGVERSTFSLSYDLGGSLFLINDAKRSSGTGRNVVVLCSLEISRIVCRNRSCNAIGSLLIVVAACTIFSAA